MAKNSMVMTVFSILVALLVSLALISLFTSLVLDFNLLGFLAFGNEIVEIIYVSIAGLVGVLGVWALTIGRFL